MEIKALLNIFLNPCENSLGHLTHCSQSCKEYSGQKVQAGIKPDPLGFWGCFPSRWDREGHLQVLIMGWVRSLGRKKKTFSTLNGIMRRITPLHPERMPCWQFLPAGPATGLLSTYSPSNLFLMRDSTNPVKAHFGSHNSLDIVWFDLHKQLELTTQKGHSSRWEEDRFFF